MFSVAGPVDHKLLLGGEMMGAARECPGAFTLAGDGGDSAAASPSSALLLNL